MSVAEALALHRGPVFQVLFWPPDISVMLPHLWYHWHLVYKGACTVVLYVMRIGSQNDPFVDRVGATDASSRSRYNDQRSGILGPFVLVNRALAWRQAAEYKSCLICLCAPLYVWNWYSTLGETAFSSAIWAILAPNLGCGGGGAESNIMRFWRQILSDEHAPPCRKCLVCHGGNID